MVERSSSSTILPPVGEDEASMRRSLSLLDRLVRLQQDRLGNRDPERPGGFQIDQQLVLDGLLDRQVAGPGALEDLVDVGRRAAKQVDEAHAVGHQATVADEDV